MASPTKRKPWNGCSGAHASLCPGIRDVTSAAAFLSKTYARVGVSAGPTSIAAIGDNMTRARVGRVIAGLVLTAIHALAPAAHAQQGSSAPARDLSELRRIVRYGETVVVTSVSGQVLRGTLAEVMVDRNAVAVDVNEIRLDLPVSGIRTIDIKEKDPLGNGALKGALYGLAGTFILALMSNESGFFEDFGAMAVLTVPLGAFFGAYVDNAHDARRTIYRGPARSAGSSARPMATTIEPRAFAIRIVW